jgi:hypothetical protein
LSGKKAVNTLLKVRKATFCWNLAVRFLPVGWVEPRKPTIPVFEARSIGIEEYLLYPVEMIDRLPTLRNPTIPVFEARSISVGEYLYILLE